jgi:hypothetical protein
MSLAWDLVTAVITRARATAELSAALPGGIFREHIPQSPSGAYAVVFGVGAVDNTNAGPDHWSRHTLQVSLFASSPAEAARVAYLWRQAFSPGSERLEYVGGHTTRVRTSKPAPLPRDPDDAHSFAGRSLFGQFVTMDVVANHAGG